jgi:hypothetical protein
MAEGLQLRAKALAFRLYNRSFAVRCCLPAERAEALFPGVFFVSFLCRHKEMKRKKRNVKRNFMQPSLYGLSITHRQPPVILTLSELSPSQKRNAGKNDNIPVNKN